MWSTALSPPIPAPTAEPIVRTLALVLLAMLTVSAANGQEPPPYTESQWRAWFATRGYGTDPYFFFPKGESGETDCPEVVRMTLLRVDSTQVELGIDPDQMPASSHATQCEVRFAAMRGRPDHAEIEPKRRLWRLLAAKDPAR